MGVKVHNLKVVCEGDCGVQASFCHYHCLADASGTLTETGRIDLHLPKGWSRLDKVLLGPVCTERRGLERALAAKVPDPSEDPPELQTRREGQVELMREVIKQDLTGESNLDEKVAPMREVLWENASDFAGTFSGVRVEVRVQEDSVELSWIHPTKELMTSLSLQHLDLVLVDPPPFIEGALVQWVNNCLRTLKGTPLRKSAPRLQN